MPSIHVLRERAARATAARHHRMQWSPATNLSSFLGGTRYIQMAECRWCHAHVMLDTKPPANGIDIGGEAVALNCTKNPRFPPVASSSTMGV